MTNTQIGELAAMGTAVLWTFSAVAWTAAGQRIGALPVSSIRLVVTSAMLMAYGLIVRGLPLPTDASAETWTVLGLSGVMGFFVSDLCLFKAFLLIGPRLSLLIQSLVPPTAAVISRVWLGDRLDGWDWLGMIVTLSGVMWVTLERPNGGDKAPRPGHFQLGVLLAVAAALTHAVGTVLSRKGIGQYDAVAATFIRVLGGLAGYVLLVTVVGRWRTVLAATRQRKAMLIVLFGSLVGPFVGVVFYMVALRHCYAGVVATIISTTPVLILPFAVFVHREKVSLRAVAGALLSLAGVALLVW